MAFPKVRAWMVGNPETGIEFGDPTLHHGNAGMHIVNSLSLRHGLAPCALFAFHKRGSDQSDEQETHHLRNQIASNIRAREVIPIPVL